MLGSLGSQLGVYQLGSVPTVGEVVSEPIDVLDLCCTTVESLNPARELTCLVMSRDVNVLNAARTLEPLCECP